MTSWVVDLIRLALAKDDAGVGKYPQQSPFQSACRRFHA